MIADLSGSSNLQEMGCRAAAEGDDRAETLAGRRHGFSTGLTISGSTSRTATSGAATR